MQLTVARIVRAHGLQGEVILEVRTDSPEERLVAGAVLATLPPEAGPLTVARARLHSGRWLVSFQEVTDRTAAEALRGVELVGEPTAEHDAWYLHELVGLRAQLPDGTVVGEVVAVEHLPAQDLLVLADQQGRTSMVPFVRQLVPEVDIAARRLVITPPEGLLAGAEAADDTAEE